MLTRKLGIDLGTANTLVYSPKNGIIINEPTVVCIDKNTKEVLTVGSEAKKMLGRTPDQIIASRPLKDGVIAEYQTTQDLLNYFINKAAGPFKFLKPDIIISIPAGITSSEKRAVMKASKKVGAKNTYLIKEPLLAAVGAGVKINKATGNLIVDIGGGTTEVACISLGSIVTSNSIKIGGDKMDQSIRDYVHKNYKVDVGLETAEKIKKKIGSALPQKQEKSIKIQAQDVVKGLPKKIEIRTNIISKAVYNNLEEITQSIKNVLQDTPPELVGDIVNKGIVLTGGGALIDGLDEYIEQSIGVKTWMADKPELCVARGCGPVLENLGSFKKSLNQERIYA